LPADLLAAMKDVAKQRGLIQTDVVAGFSLSERWTGEYPYVLVGAIRGRTTEESFDNLERELAEAFGPANVQQAPGKAAEAAGGAPVVDRSNSRMWVQGKKHVEGIGPVICHNIGMVGSERIVFLCCYTKEMEESKWLPAFEAIAQGFRFNPGYDFVPHAGGLHGQIFGDTTNRLVIGAMVLAALVVGMVWWRNSSNRAAV